MNYLKLALTLFIVSALGCKDKVPKTYRVVLQSLPEFINPHTNRVNIFHYINLQLYYPMFIKRSDGELSSAFLDMERTRAMSSQFDQFQMCIIRGIQFSDGTQITVDHLVNALHNVHKLRGSLPLLKNIEMTAGCALVSLQAPDINYFHDLTGLQSTILSDHQIHGHRIGLGPFKIKEKTPNKIILERITTASNDKQFQFIEFIKYQPEILSETDLKIQDWNHLYQLNLPKETTNSFQTIHRPILKTYFLLVRIKNDKVRQRFSSCFPGQQILKYLNLNLVPGRGIIPKGLPGSLEGLASTPEKTKCETRLPLSIRYFVYSDAQLDPLKEFITDTKELLPSKIALIRSTLDETIRAATSEENFMTLVGADPLDSASEDFFNGFVGVGGFPFQPLKLFEMLLKKATASRRSVQYGELITEAHKELLNSGYVIPLGQLVAEQKYPSNITHITFQDRVHGFPDVQEMEEK